jgi:hypothetical protein
LLLDRKPEVLAALDEASAWRTRHAEALAHWSVLHTDAEAAELAWGELVNRWHRLHGARIRAPQCAGCGKPIGTGPPLELADGCRVHLDTLDCLIGYGRRWRGAATAALQILGLIPPPGETV